VVIRPFVVATSGCVDIDSAPIERTRGPTVRHVPMNRSARPTHAKSRCNYTV
jgi:hypothetical protein